MGITMRSIIRWGIFLTITFSFVCPFHVQADSVVDISTAAQFNDIHGNLAGTYRLTNNIDLSSISNWTPLGNTSSPFTGSLDGAGHTINNLVVANTQSSDQGLFGVIGAAGIVSNLQIKNANITAADSAGILAGTNQGTISRVYSQGIISGANIVGGLVGTNSGSITNAYTRATVSGSDKNGGLVGINNGTLTNTYAVSKVSAAVTNNYIQFDGFNDYISIPHNPAYITNSFTLEAWFQWTAVDRTSVSFITGKGLENFEIHTAGGSGANGVRFIPVMRTDTSYNDLRAYQDIHNVLQPGWNHVAASWDYANEEVRVFLNGIPQDIWQNGINVGPVASLQLLDPNTNPLANNTEEFFIGARNDQNYGLPSLFFQGNIADVRFWNTVRTPEQIDADKYKQLNGNESGLIGYWKLDEANGTTVYDSSSLANNGFLLGDATRVQETSANGGLVAVSTGSINNSFYDSSVSGLSDTGKGTPLTTDQMKTKSSFGGWDFSTVWKMIDGSTFPSLFTINVTVNQATGQSDPTNSSPINFTATFSEPVDTDTLTSDDITLGGTAGAATAVISEIAPNDGTTFNVAVSGMTGEGSVSASIGADKVSDLAGNLNVASTSTDNEVTYDMGNPTITVEQATGQPDPTNSRPINFTATFSEPVDTDTLTSDDITLGGTAGAATAVISEIAPNDGTTFNVAVSGMTGEGSVSASIGADKVSDLAGNLNVASTSTDNEVTYDMGNPTITVEQAAGQSDPTNSSPVNFTATFSEPVDTDTLTSDDITLGGTAGAATAVISEIAPNDSTTFNIAVSGMTGEGSVSASIGADKVSDLAGNLNAASTSTDNEVSYDMGNPAITVEQATGQSDPTNSSPVNFTATFSEPVDTDTLTSDDITLGGTAGAATAVVSEIAHNDGTTFNIAVSGMTGEGSVTASIGANKVSDLAGNLNAASTSTDNEVTYDMGNPTITVEQATGQPDPTNSSSINFTATFSEPVDTATLTSDDITLGGTAGAATAVISEIAPNDGTTFNIAVSGMTGEGSVSASIGADKVSDLAGNLNVASTSTDNEATYDLLHPAMSSTDLNAVYTGTGPDRFIVAFSENVFDPAGNTGEDDVTNPDNFMLINKGLDGLTNTLSCLGGVLGDDSRIPVKSVNYDLSTFEATVSLYDYLPAGSYRLFICGTTSIVDLAGNPLNDGVDYTFDLEILDMPARLPATGFPTGMVTRLPSQPADKNYSATDLVLEIPSIRQKMKIVGVPQSETGWDVTWLGNNVGWLTGSAFPTWVGNSVITGHVWDSSNKPGPFALLRKLKYGEKFHIHAFGQTFTYEVRESRIVTPENVYAAMKHEELDWVTLVTCEAFSVENNTYPYRRMVRAVLVGVK